jgi:hypothetical protein
MSSSTFPTLFNDFNFSLNGSQIPQTSQQPDLSELLKYPCVMELYRQNQALQSSQIKLAEIAEKSFNLQDKTVALQSQVLSLESELSAEKLKVNVLSTELRSLQINTNS